MLGDRDGISHLLQSVAFEVITELGQSIRNIEKIPSSSILPNAFKILLLMLPVVSYLLKEIFRVGPCHAVRAVAQTVVFVEEVFEHIFKVKIVIIIVIVPAGPVISIDVAHLISNNAITTLVKFIAPIACIIYGCLITLPSSIIVVVVIEDSAVSIVGAAISCLILASVSITFLGLTGRLEIVTVSTGVATIPIALSIGLIAAVSVVIAFITACIIAETIIILLLATFSIIIAVV